jgi:hypothetical protein
MYNKIGYSIELVKRVLVAGYNEALVDKQWIILKHTHIPIHSALFPNIPSHTIKWSCQTNPPRFTDPHTPSSEVKHISYLGFLVTISGYDPIDLTDWINTVQWSGVVEPSLVDIFTVWCCEEGNAYFNLIPLTKVDIITDTGDSLTKGLNDSVINSCSTNGCSGYKQNNIDGSNPVRSMDAVFSSSGC